MRPCAGDTVGARPTLGSPVRRWRPATGRGRTSRLGALLLAVAALAGCGTAGASGTDPGGSVRSAGASSLAAPPTGDILQVPLGTSAATGTAPGVPDPLLPAPPGTLISAVRLPPGGGVPPGATAYRVLFHSRSDDGQDIAESGDVVVPDGPPPPGGYPIVSWAHGTTGIADSCAPSEQPDIAIPYLSEFLSSGYIVAATDYEGLGTAGLHPYLVGESEGRGVIDAARAARAVAGAVASDSVVFIGHSQGGQAALFAAQEARQYAPDLFVAGAVAIAPVNNVSALAPADPGPQADGTDGYEVMALWDWSQIYASPGLLAAVLTPRAAAEASIAGTACSATVGATFGTTPTDQVFRPGWRQAPGLRAELLANEPGWSPSDAPVLVMQGADDTLTTPEAARTMADRMCTGRHDTVELDVVPGSDHGSILSDGQGRITQWIADRLAGRPAPDNCPT